MPSAAYPSLVGNCDQWFVDYIILDTNRTDGDTIYHDVAFQYPIDFKIDNYQSVPYKHYLEHYNESNFFNQNCLMNYRNNDNQNRTINSLNIIFKQKEGLLPDDTLFFGSSNLPARTNFELSKEDINYLYPETSYDEMNFEMQVVLDLNTIDFRKFLIIYLIN